MTDADERDQQAVPDQPTAEAGAAAAPAPGHDEVPVAAHDAPASAADASPDQSPAEQAAQPSSEQELTSEEAEVEDDLARAKRDLAELTGDLQRLQAEFLNYKRRVERDRELLRENAVYAVLVPIIDVLDTIDRAREHEPLESGFKAVAEQLETVVANLGLTKFGAPGDAFDPNLHDALTDPEVSVTACKVVAKAGYRIGDRVVRAAQVLVVDPEST